jgi:hypothetical protein
MGVFPWPEKPSGKGERNMNQKQGAMSLTGRGLMAILCALMLVPGDALSYVQSSAAQQTQAAPSADTVPKVPPDQLDSLVAPIALYPDPLLAQVLAASTYPLEIVQLQQWLAKNSGL